MKAISRRRLVTTAGLDFYPTPRWATRALLHCDHTIRGPVWDPACGDGALSRTLHEVGICTWDTDIHDRGYGVPGRDFLQETDSFGTIITNPPFNMAMQFTEHALQLATEYVALLMQLSYLESERRFQRLFSSPNNRPTRYYVFAERLTMYPGGIRTGGGSTTAFAWFVWDRKQRAPAPTETHWIPPGYKSLYGVDIVGPRDGFAYRPRRTTAIGAEPTWPPPV